VISATSGSGGFSTASITSALESLAFFDHRSKGLGICFLDTGQPLKVAGLPASSQLTFGLLVRVTPPFGTSFPSTNSQASLIWISIAE